MRLLSITEQPSARDLLSANERLPRHFYGMELKDLLAKARRRKGLSQRALAQLIGVGGSAVAQWEGGTTKPTTDNMAAIRALLDIEGSIDAPGSSPYAGQLVDDPDELALLRFWRGLEGHERSFMLKRLMSGTPPRKPPPVPRKSS